MFRKIRLIEPGNHTPYRKSILNLFVYNRYIRNPSTGLNILATIIHREYADTLMYSESISQINFADIADADIVFLSLNTFNAMRGYALAKQIKQRGHAVVVLGGIHASLHHTEAVQYGDYVLRGDGDDLVLPFLHALEAGCGIDHLPGIVYLKDGKLVYTGEPVQPEEIDTIPDRSLMFDYARLASRLDTLWPQVHASRGCPHSCDYCTVIAQFGRKIRKRSPENVVEDIRQAIAFHRRKGIPRLNRCVWITDDNFPEDRLWAMAVCDAIIQSGIKAYFSVQARYEAGFDDELLEKMKQAGFMELALGIEFLNDDSFEQFHKKSNYNDILRSVRNIQAHGLGVRGLFIVGAETDTVGVGDKIVDYVIENELHGALIQSMFFVPGTPVYERAKDNLIHENWEKYCGNVVHYPAHIKPHELQMEIIRASARIYSPRRLLHALLHYPWINKMLFVGEFFWQISFRSDRKKELANLLALDSADAEAVPEYTLSV